MRDSGSKTGDEAPESVLRLATVAKGECYLAPHHVEVARRLARLIARACLIQRTTMSYDPTRIGACGGRPVQGDLADSAIEARRQLGKMVRQVPRDCWAVLIDTCGFDKGLQQIEQERGWPRRSAKLVLRIGLEQLAALTGLTETAEGPPEQEIKSWVPDRPAMFADKTH